MEEKWELVKKQPGERESLRPLYVPYSASPAAPWGVQRCFKALGILKEVELVNSRHPSYTVLHLPITPSHRHPPFKVTFSYFKYGGKYLGVGWGRRISYYLPWVISVAPLASSNFCLKLLSVPPSKWVLIPCSHITGLLNVGPHWPSSHLFFYAVIPSQEALWVSTFLEKMR